MIPMPLADKRSDGMMLPGNGWPVSGSRMICGELKNGFVPSSWLKSPRRIASVGTVAVFVATWKKSTHSCAPKKNSLSLNISPGIGPPNE